MAERPEHAASRTWQVSSGGRIGAGIFVVGGGILGGLGAAAAVAEGEWLVVPIAAAVGLGMSLLAYRCGFHAALQADNRGLVVRNPFGTHVIAWSDFKRIEPGYSGLVITKQDGSRRTAWVVQRSNWASAKGEHTRADDVVSEIASLAESATGHPQQHFELSESEKAEARRAKRRYLMFAVPTLVGAFILRIVVDFFEIAR